VRAAIAALEVAPQRLSLGRWQLTVHIGAQTLERFPAIHVIHLSKQPNSSLAKAARALCSRDLTVPTGTASTRAISS
jgi:hypothetical protein